MASKADPKGGQTSGLPTDPTEPPPTLAPPSASGGGGRDGSLEETLPATNQPRPTVTHDAAGEGGVLAPVEPRRYDVGGELARGGIGRILSARDVRLDRPVAIKEMLRSQGEGGDKLRFAREALVTARLQHPAIVPVYEAGTWPDGAPFFAMKLVEGVPLDRAIASAIEPAERLALLPRVIDVANALAYAHERRVIHRDLKPANVLCGAHGETVVIDWGLAKDLTAAADTLDGATTGDGTTTTPRDVETRGPGPASPGRGVAGPSERSERGPATIDGTVMGTPAYMPPEQARGQRVDERADVYAIGAVLYHVLSGDPPYRGRTSAEVLAQVMAGPPEPLSARAPGLPADLTAIVERAMAHDPAARYPSARELAEDLTRFQSGQLVSAHQYSAWSLVTRFLRRHRAAVSVALVALILAAIGGLMALGRLVDAKRRALDALEVAEREGRRADERADDLALMQARLALDHDPGEALTWLGRLTPRFTRWPEARLIAADARARGVPAARHRAGGTVRGLAFSHGGGVLAVSAARESGVEVEVLDVLAGRAHALPPRTGAAPSPAFVPGSGDLALPGAGGTVEVWSLARPRPTRLGLRAEDRHDGEVLALATGGRRVASGGADGQLRVWALEGGAVTAVPLGAPVTRVALSQNGEFLVAATAANEVRLLHAGSLRALAVAKLSAPIAALALSADGTQVAAGDESGQLIRQGRQAEPAHPGGVTALAFLPGGALVSTGRDGRVLLWAEGAAEPRELTREPQPVVAMAPSPDGRVLAVAAGGLALIEVASGARRELDGHGAGVVAVAWSDDARRLASGDAAGEVLLWEPSSWEGEVLAGAGAAVTAVAASPDGQLVALAHEDGRVRLWTPKTGEQRDAGAHQGRVTGIDWSGDGAFLASGGFDDSVRLFDLRAGESRVVGRHGRDVIGVAFAPAGARSRLAWASGDGALVVLDAASGARSVLAEGGAAFSAFAWSPDGDRIATAGEDGEVRVYRVADGAVIARQGAGAAAELLAWAPGGDTLVWAARGELGAVVWRLDTGARQELPARHAAALVGLAYSADGQWLVTIDASGELRRWSPELGAHERLEGPPAASLRLSPDGATAAIALVGGGVTLFDIGAGLSRTLATPQPVGAIAWSPDSQALVAGSRDGAVRRFRDDLPRGEALRPILPQPEPQPVREGLDKPRTAN